MATRYLHADLQQTGGTLVPVTTNAGTLHWQTLTDDDGQWSDGWIGNQLDRGIVGEWDPILDGLALPGAGAYLLGFLTTSQQVPMQAGTLLQIGNVSADGARGLRVRQRSDGTVVFQILDDTAGAPQAAQKVTNPAAAEGEEIAFFIYLDNRGDCVGSNTMMLFRYLPGSIIMRQQGQPVDVGEFAPLTGGLTDDRKKFRIGFASSNGGATFDHLTAGNRIRNLLIFSFGDSAPPAINKLLEELSLNQLVPTQYALDLAGVTPTRQFRKLQPDATITLPDPPAQPRG